MKGIIKIAGLKISTDETFFDQKYGHTPALSKQMAGLSAEAQDENNNAIIDKLKTLIDQFPNSPRLKNFLHAAFHYQGKTKEASETEALIINKHPDYIFLKTNIANRLISNDDLEKVPQVLCQSMHLQDMAPSRKIFHVYEATGFYISAMQYFMAKANIPSAENCLSILEKIAPDDYNVEELKKKFIFIKRLSFKNFISNRSKRVIPNSELKLLPPQVSTKPSFNHQIIEKLYEADKSISTQCLQEILELPRITLIEDLEKILFDAQCRFDYFKNEKLEDQNYFFPIHALFLLAELKANESLPKIKIFFENNEKFLNYWLGDYLTEDLWWCFYQFTDHQLSFLENLLLQPGIYAYVKSSISNALAQVVFHQRNKRKQILNIYIRVLTKFNHASLSDNLIDTNLLGSIVANLLDCHFVETQPLIKELYKKQYVEIDICGSYKDVAEDFEHPTSSNPKLKIFSLFEFYDKK